MNNVLFLAFLICALMIPKESNRLWQMGPVFAYSRNKKDTQELLQEQLKHRIFQTLSSIQSPLDNLKTLHGQVVQRIFIRRSRAICLIEKRA